jgi:TRAP-type C4-dicarboxylate transport system substrate-binding protein
MKFSLSVAVLALAAGSACAQQFTMKLSSPVINDVSHEWMKAMKAGVEGRTGGKVRVEVYPANQLGQLPATVEGVALGTIEVTMPAIGFLVGLEPRFQVLDAPGLFDSVEHAQRVFADPEVKKRLSTFGESKGIEPLVTFANGPMMLLTHKGVRSLGDFKGQKIRAPGGAPVQMEPFKRLGASPLSMPPGEALTAMQNRTIDGLTAGIALFTSFKYYDIAKGLTYLPGSVLVANATANKKFLQSLGRDLEAIVRDEAQKNEKLFSTWLIDDVAKVEKTWVANGGQLLRLSPADSKQFLATVGGAAGEVLAANPQIKADYHALLAAAKKHRR